MNSFNKERVECYLCHKAEEDDPEVEIRYYGPKGAPICFDCMISNPAREAEAKRQFSAQLEGCGPVALIDGDKSGPRPFGGNRS